ncbi:hypothetical protein ABPG77_002794 [Micractinium sp. CCAP 211/92]
MADEQTSFVFRVSITFASTQDRDELLEAWRPVAEWVKENEPDTLAYEATISESNPKHVMVFERYASKAALDAHLATDIVKKFFAEYLEDGAPWRKEHPYELAFETFHETRIGYLHH